MKGQYITIEHVIFFAVGVMIVILVYVIFGDVNAIIEEDVAKNQLKATGSMITGAIINVFEASNNTDSAVYYNLSIPPSVSNCIYAVLITAGKKLRLECTENRVLSVELDLYNFNIVAQKIIYSTRGFVTISSKDGLIELS